MTDSEFRNLNIQQQAVEVEVWVQNVLDATGEDATFTNVRESLDSFEDEVSSLYPALINVVYEDFGLHGAD